MTRCALNTKAAAWLAASSTPLVASLERDAATRLGNATASGSGAATVAAAAALVPAGPPACAGARTRRNTLQPTHGAQLATSNLDVAKRAFSSRAQIWDHLTLPSRRGQFNEAVVVSSLLPHRASFTPQFTPHGVQLVPKAVVQQQQQQVAKGAAASGPQPASAGTATPTEAAPAAAKAKASSSRLHDWGAEQDDAEATMAADRTLLWRRLKLKKHKIKKRLRRDRYKST